MEEHEVELIDYLRVIWRRKSLILSGTLLAAGTAPSQGALNPSSFRGPRFPSTPGGFPCDGNSETAMSTSSVTRPAR